MAWHFKDSQGVKGPLTETQIRELLNSEELDSTAMVRQGESSWIAAETVRVKFARLEQEGIYLRSQEGVFGPFVQRRADELQLANPGRFDAYKVGLNGEWLLIASQQAKSVAIPSPPPPPKQVLTSTVAIPSPPRNPRVIGSTGKNKTSPQKIVALGCGGCLLVPCLLIALLFVFGLILKTINPELGAEYEAIEAAKSHVSSTSESLADLLPKNRLGKPIDPSSGRVKFTDSQTKVEPVRDESGKLTGFRIYLSYEYIDTGSPGGWRGFVDLKGKVTPEKF